MVSVGREVRVAILGDATSFNKAFTAAWKNADTFTDKMKVAGSALTSPAGIAAGLAVTGAALVKFGKDAVDTALRYSAAARDFQRVTGTSAETASRMVAVFDDLEISQESASKAFFKLAREVGQGGLELDKFGVKVKFTKDGNLDLQETMLRVADAYQGMTNQADRAALIQEAFGRGGKDLIPILEQGREKIEQLFRDVPEGQIFSQDQIDDARKYELAMDDLKDSVDEFKIKAGQVLIPVLTDIATALASATRGVTGLDDALQNVTGVSGLGALGKGLTFGFTAVNKIAGVFGIGGAKADEYADSQKRLAEAQQEVIRLSANGERGTKEYSEAVKEAKNAQNDYDVALRRANKGLDEAAPKHTKVTDAVDKEVDSLKVLKGWFDEIVKGLDDFYDKNLDVEGSAISMDRAIADFNETMKNTNLTTLEGREAFNNVKGSVIDFGKAVFDSKGGTDNFVQATRDQIGALSGVRDTLAPGSPLRTFLDQYIWDLGNRIPPAVQTDLILREIYKPYTIPTENPPTFAGGGVVPGPMGAPMLAVVHGGETIYDPLNPDPTLGGAMHFHLPEAPLDPVAYAQVCAVTMRAMSWSYR